MGRDVVILSTTPDLSEMRDLVSSLGLDVVGVEVQERARPDPQTYLGSGRVEALARALAREPSDDRTDLVVVADRLSPSQVLRLERELDRPVFDRVRLILEIFADRANSEEGKLQVELAQLRYDLPILREAIRQAKQGERAGFLAGGATGIETQMDHLQRRRVQVQERLDQVRGQRDTRRKHRKRGGFWQVSLAGYTNAGKSTLLNRLTNGRVKSENRLFSTLETRTRRIEGAPGSSSRLLLTDTVGFIEDLPPWLVEAFHATLEEIALADLVLLVVDASEPRNEVHRKMETSLEVLRGFLAERERPDLADNLFLVFNKVDRLDDQASLEALADHYGFAGRWSAVSALTGRGLDALLARIRRAIPDRQVVTVELPYAGDSYALIDELDRIGELELVREDGHVTARAAVPKAKLQPLEDRVDALGGRLVRT